MLRLRVDLRPLENILSPNLEALIRGHLPRPGGEETPRSASALVNPRCKHIDIYSPFCSIQPKTLSFWRLFGKQGLCLLGRTLRLCIFASSSFVPERTREVSKPGTKVRLHVECLLCLHLIPGTLSIHRRTCPTPPGAATRPAEPPSVGETAPDTRRETREEEERGGGRATHCPEIEELYGKAQRGIPPVSSNDCRCAPGCYCTHLGRLPGTPPLPRPPRNTSPPLGPWKSNQAESTWSALTTASPAVAAERITGGLRRAASRGPGGRSWLGESLGDFRRREAASPERCSWRSAVVTTARST